jgi:hypothetical protein
MLVADPETLPGAEPLYRSKDSLTICKFKATRADWEKCAGAGSWPALGDEERSKAAQKVALSESRRRSR